MIPAGMILAGAKSMPTVQCKESRHVVEILYSEEWLRYADYGCARSIIWSFEVKDSSTRRESSAIVSPSAFFSYFQFFVLRVRFSEHGRPVSDWRVEHGWGFVVVVWGLVLLGRGLGTVVFGVLPEITMA